MSLIERMRIFYYDYLDTLQLYGLHWHFLNEVGIVTNKSVKSDGLRKYDLNMVQYGTYTTQYLQ